MLSRYNINSDALNSTGTGRSEREAAAMLAKNEADVAPGARAAAHEFGLGFIPFGWEAFDLVLPRSIWFRRLFQDLINRLKSKECRAMAEQLTGYDLSQAGKLVWGDE
jgi:molybdate-binding protein